MRLDIGECIKKHKNIAHANFSLPFRPKNIENFIGLRFSICHRVQTNAQYITLTAKCTVLCCFFFRVGFWIGIPKEYTLYRRSFQKEHVDLKRKAKTWNTWKSKKKPNWKVDELHRITRNEKKTIKYRSNFAINWLCQVLDKLFQRN